MNIPTAEEFRKKLLAEQSKRISVLEFELLLAKEYAKLCVEVALKAASENARMEWSNYKGSGLSEREALDDKTDIYINKQSILSSYPLENIK